MKLRCFIFIFLSILLFAPAAMASEIQPTSSPTPTATPSPDESLGDSISDNFNQSVDDITGNLNDLTANERLPNLAGGDFSSYLRHALSIFTTPDIVTFLVLWVIAAIIIGVYRQLKE